MIKIFNMIMMKKLKMIKMKFYLIRNLIYQKNNINNINNKYIKKNNNNNNLIK